MVVPGEEYCGHHAEGDEESDVSYGVEEGCEPVAGVEEEVEGLEFEVAYALPLGYPESADAEEGFEGGEGDDDADDAGEGYFLGTGGCGCVGGVVFVGLLWCVAFCVAHGVWRGG
ncbi:hypothetical protein CFELI_14090 [Corynebacterium felinum]|nr:hypothetical protein CFELI_14090 [Corynebacterium felinum]